MVEIILPGSVASAVARSLAGHLPCRLVLPLSLIRDLPKQIVPGPREAGDLHDRLGPYSAHARQSERRPASAEIRAGTCRQP